jgi:hypothetical protein
VEVPVDVSPVTTEEFVISSAPGRGGVIGEFEIDSIILIPHANMEVRQRRLPVRNPSDTLTAVISGEEFHFPFDREMR